MFDTSRLEFTKKIVKLAKNKLITLVTNAGAGQNDNIDIWQLLSM